MNFEPLAELIASAADFATPVLGALVVLYTAAKAEKTYRWQKALDQRVWWYRRMLGQLIRFKTEVVIFSTKESPSDLERKRYEDAVHRMVFFSALSPLYADKAAHDAVWELRRRLEAIEEMRDRLEPQREIIEVLVAIQRSIDLISREARQVLDIPALGSGSTSLTEVSA